MLRDLFGDGQLHQDAVDRGIIVEMNDILQQLSFCDGLGVMYKIAYDVGLFRCLELHADICTGIGSVTDLDDGEGRLEAGIDLLSLLDVCIDLFSYGFRNGGAIYLLGSHVAGGTGKGALVCRKETRLDTFIDIQGV